MVQTANGNTTCSCSLSGPGTTDYIHAAGLPAKREEIVLQARLELRK